MKIKLTLEKVLALSQALNQLKHKGSIFHVKVYFRLAQLKTKVDEVVKSFDESKENLLRKYAELDENGEVVTSNGNVPVFKTKKDEAAVEKEFKELRETTQEFTFEKIKLSDFGDKEVDFSIIDGLLPIIDQD
ncbi:hypothetical protein V6R21_20210 [Limibacter armeniacum]|uniref:hypothetical protein n=1 Tax=Limibacter armeniacum TaxID=466084 RepID=UPI002FE55BFE